MNSFNVEIFSLLIIIILVYDYHIKYQHQLTINNAIYLSIAGSMVIISVINTILSMWTLSNFCSYILIIIAYIMAIIPSLGIYLYLKVNAFEQRGQLRKILLFAVLFALAYIMLILTIITINYNSLLHSPTYILDLQKTSRALLVVLIPSLLIIVESTYNYFIRKIHYDYKLFLAQLFPIIGVTIDIFVQDLVLFIPSYTLSLLMLYIYRNNISIYIDPLTGVYNRKFLERQQTRIKSPKNVLAAYYIDVDKFKDINDNYGHSAGDRALINVSNILKKSIRSNDFVIRVGGDEFLVIVTLKNNNEINQIIKRVRENLRIHNKHAKIKLSLSIGYDIYDEDKNNFEDFIKILDDKMYKEKEDKKKS